MIPALQLKTRGTPIPSSLLLIVLIIPELLLSSRESRKSYNGRWQFHLTSEKELEMSTGAPKNNYRLLTRTQ